MIIRNPGAADGGTAFKPKNDYDYFLEAELPDQPRDFVAYAEQRGLTFKLDVRASTALSGPLQDAVDAGEITLIGSLP